MEKIHGAIGAPSLNLRVSKGILEKDLSRDLKLVKELADQAESDGAKGKEKRVPNRGNGVCADLVLREGVVWG